MAIKAQTFFIDLLFDAQLRAQWCQDPEAVLVKRNLSEADKALFLKVDPYGLVLDAEGRGQYLMSALCRSFPLTVACLGTVKESAARLQMFLKNIPTFESTEARTLAFGQFLVKMVQDNPWYGKPSLVELVLTLHGFEMAVAENTARCRAAVSAGERPPQIEKYSSGMVKKRPLVLPPYLLICEMPVSLSVLDQALGSPRPEDIWQRVHRHQNLEASRLEAVAYGSTLPVTTLARAQITGIQGERGGTGAMAPLIHVTHKKIEISGRKANFFSIVEGRKCLSAYPSDSQRILRQFLDLGFLALK
jgi:hypothetical protein